MHINEACIQIVLSKHDADASLALYLYNFICLWQLILSDPNKGFIIGRTLESHLWENNPMRSNPSSITVYCLFVFPLCLSQYLVQANPVPCGGHEVLLDGVVKKCILVGAPHTHGRYVHQWCVKALPQLRERQEKRDRVLAKTQFSGGIRHKSAKQSPSIPQ